MSMQAILLFAHGARDPRWAEPFEAVAQTLRVLRPGCEVRLAFLEFMSPTLPQAAQAAVESGALRVDIVPLFLGAGGHVRRDLPELLEQMRGAHPQATFTLHPAVGEISSVVQAMAAAAAQLAEGSAP